MNITLQSVPENIDQRLWVSIPVKASNSVGTLTVDGETHYAQIIDNILYAYVALEFGKIAKGIYTEIPQGKPQDFVYSNWIMDDPAGLIPLFSLVLRDKDSIAAIKSSVIESSPEKAKLEVVVDNNIRKVFKYTTSISEIELDIEGFIEVMSGQDIVNYEIRMTCQKDIGSINATRLYMVLGEEPIVTNAKSKNLKTRYLGDGKWAADLITDFSIYKGFTHKQDGAILCRGGKLPTQEDEIRLNNLISRKEAKIVGRIA